MSAEGSVEVLGPALGAARARSAAGALARGIAAVAIVLVATVAGTGWLYLLRHTGALDAGPRLVEALPLQRLARDDAQPLLRMIVAWLPAGVVAGAMLGAATRLTRAARATVVGVLGWIVLFLAGAASDSVTASEKLLPHIAPQFGRGAIWLAAALMAAGALAVGGRRRRA
jgi:hypothetical protein